MPAGKQDIAKYIQLEGELLKKSTSRLLGYQTKFWKIIDNGNKIAYRTPGSTGFDPINTFNLIDVLATETDQQQCLLLITPKRNFELKAKSVQQRDIWINALTKLKKNIKKHHLQTKKKISSALASLTTNSTMPENVFGKDNPEHSSRLSPDKRLSKDIQPINQISQEYRIDVEEYLRRMPPIHAKYNVLTICLQTQIEHYFSSKKQQQLYMLFSSKSLYPQQHINDDNLITSQLPHWAQIDKFYRIGQHNTHTLMFDVTQILTISQHNNYCGLIITLSTHQTQQYICQTLQQRNRLKKLLQIATINAKQSWINKKHYRKNHDKLIQLHSNNLDQFNQKVSDIILPLIPVKHNYESVILSTLFDNFMPLIQELLTILENKCQVPTSVITDFLRIVHEEIRVHLKLVWDTSHGSAKSGQLLIILRNIANYEQTVHKYVSDSEMFTAMKQLSKIYIRLSYANFESIIIAIVEQQKKINTFQFEQQVLQTHGITDLFKFIYDVFELAIPCWKSKLHLHNVNRLMLKAISVFIKQLKAAVDEEDIPVEQMIGIANNYFRFCEEIDGFYHDKFQDQLKQQTKDNYQKLKDQFRQISMIILDKLALPMKISLKIHFEKQSFHTAIMQQVYMMISYSDMQVSVGKLHDVFQKRYCLRLFETIRQCICKMLQKQIKKGKKKGIVENIVKQIEVFQAEFEEMALQLSGSKLKINKDLGQIIKILTLTDIDSIKAILDESHEPLKTIYFKIMTLRNDYYQNSPLHKQLKLPTQQPGVKSSQVRTRSRVVDLAVPNLPNYYMKQFDNRSELSEHPTNFNLETQNQRPQIKLISEGYLLRSRHDINTYEKIYVRLKNGVMYIYENQGMQRCQNTIEMDQISKINVPNPDRATFIVIHKSLGREKQIRLKCENVELRQRWVWSLELQLKRMGNQRKVKGKIRIKQKKNKLIIDYYELEKGEDCFSYGQ